MCLVNQLARILEKGRFRTQIPVHFVTLVMYGGNEALYNECMHCARYTTECPGVLTIRYSKCIQKQVYLTSCRVPQKLCVHTHYPLQS